MTIEKRDVPVHDARALVDSAQPTLVRGASGCSPEPWDSAGGLARSNGAEGDARSGEAPCTSSFHSAFVDPRTPPDAPDRWSIEVRCALLDG